MEKGGQRGGEDMGGLSSRKPDQNIVYEKNTTKESNHNLEKELESQKA